MRKTMLLTLATALVALAANHAAAQIQNGTSNYFGYGYQNGAYAQMVITPGVTPEQGVKGAANQRIDHERINSQWTVAGAWSPAALGTGWFTSNGQPLKVNASVVSQSSNYQDKYHTHYSWNPVLDQANSAKYISSFPIDDRNYTKTYHKGESVAQTGAGTTIAEGNKWTHTYQQRPGIAWESFGWDGDAILGTGNVTNTISYGVGASGLAYSNGGSANDSRPTTGEYNVAALNNVRQQALQTQGLNDNNAKFNYFVVDLTGITSDMVRFDSLTIGNVNGLVSTPNVNTQAINVGNLEYGKINIFGINPMAVTSYGISGDILLASDAVNSLFKETSLYFVTDMQGDVTLAAKKQAVLNANAALASANAQVAGANGVIADINAKIADYQAEKFDSYEEALAAYQELAVEYDAAKAALVNAEQLAANAKAAQTGAENAVTDYQLYGENGLVELLAKNEEILGYVDAGLAAKNNVDYLLAAETAFDLLSLSDLGAEPSATPEPATMLIFGLGVAGAGIVARRRMKK